MTIKATAVRLDHWDSSLPISFLFFSFFLSECEAVFRVGGGGCILVQLLLFYPVSLESSLRSPELSPQDILAELRRVDAAAARAHDLEAALL